jgi:Na+-transporting methylmalonyl-CoA/oxaloacetate decarboxylase gamma subunit
MNEEIIFGMGGMGFVLVILTLITILAAVIVSQVLKTSRAKIASMAQITRDEAYRKLAEEAVAAQQKMTEEQHQLVADVAEMKDRITAIEKMLREIE